MRALYMLYIPSPNSLPSSRANGTHVAPRENRGATLVLHRVASPLTSAMEIQQRGHVMRSKCPSNSSCLKPIVPLLQIELALSPGGQREGLINDERQSGGQETHEERQQEGGKNTCANEERRPALMKCHARLTIYSILTLAFQIPRALKSSVDLVLQPKTLGKSMVVGSLGLFI